jgi:simple sugar transport system permease protein
VRVVGGLLVALAVLASIGLALAMGAAALAAARVPVWSTYRTMLVGAVGSAAGLEGSLLYATPIMFCGLAAAIAFRAKVWNIGGEGQLAMGAFGAALAALHVSVPGPLALGTVLLSGMVWGALWALVPAVLKIWLGVNEVLSSLMLNYVAALWIDFLVFGPWRDPGMGGWPYSAPFPRNALLPQLGHGGLDLGLPLAIGLAVLMQGLLAYSRWGFEIAVVGQSRAAARYAGMSVAGTTVLVMGLGGAIAALAGVSQVAGTAGRLYHLAPGYGYIGILVSWLARHHPLAIVVTGAGYGMLLQGGASLQMVQVDPSLVGMLQAAIILCALAGLTFAQRRVERRRLEMAG